MDNLKTLMDKRNYNLVIKITENSKDSTDLFYRISAYTALGQLENALNVIKDNRKILEKKLDLLIKIHVQLLFMLNRSDEARDEMDKYYQLPYYSQAVEEKLNSLPKEIAKKEKESYMMSNHNKFIDERWVNPKNSDDVISAVELINDEDLYKFSNKIQNVLTSDISREVKNYIIFRMIKAKVNFEFLYKINEDEIIKINPLNAKNPFESDIFKDVCNKLSSLSKNPSLQKNMFDVLMIYISNQFPYDINFEPLFMFYAIKLIGCDLLNIDNNEVLDEIISSELSLKKVIEVKDIIKQKL